MRLSGLMITVVVLALAGIFFGPSLSVPTAQAQENTPGAAGQRIAVTGPCQPAEKALGEFERMGWSAAGGGADFMGDGVTVWVLGRRFMVAFHLVDKGLLCVIAAGPVWQRAIAKIKPGPRT